MKFVPVVYGTKGCEVGSLKDACTKNGGRTKSQDKIKADPESHDVQLASPSTNRQTGDVFRGNNGLRFNKIVWSVQLEYFGLDLMCVRYILQVEGLVTIILPRAALGIYARIINLN